MRLSVLDQAPITKGNRAPDALKKAEELAILADELGYHRMWMAEHHGTTAFASSAPEVTAAHLGCKNEKYSNWHWWCHDDALFTIETGRSV